MILILSRETAEISTDKVIDWLIYLKKDFYRFNGEDFYNETCVINFSMNEKGVWVFEIIDKRLNKTIKSSQITSVWFRRDFYFDYMDNVVNETIENVLITNSIEDYLKNELKIIYELFEYSLQDVFWLSRPSLRYPNKLQVLSLANQVGLKSPKTLISNSIDSIKKYYTINESLITKPLKLGPLLEENGQLLSLSTAKVNFDKYLDAHQSDFIFPGLIQNEIKKDYEIRSFFLIDKIYSIAIYSQVNQETKLDFRNFKTDLPRMESINLPNSIESKIFKLMNKMNLNSGSLDIIKTSDDYIFLEVNPVGQFDFVSQSGNYNLERIIAKKLN